MITFCSRTRPVVLASRTRWLHRLSAVVLRPCTSFAVLHPDDLADRFGGRIYDYQDVAAISNYLAWNCQAAQGARGGVCRANSGLYQPSVPDFYVQYVAVSP
jgi:hypothetical protein